MTRGLMLCIAFALTGACTTETIQLRADARPPATDATADSAPAPDAEFSCVCRKRCRDATECTMIRPNICDDPPGLCVEDDPLVPCTSNAGCALQRECLLEFDSDTACPG